MLIQSPVKFDAYVYTGEYLENPYPYYDELRVNAPVFWSERLGAWLLTRYDDVQAAFRDPRLISGDRMAAYFSQLPEPVHADVQPLCQHLEAWLVFMDPPDHTRLRVLVNKAFTGRMVENLRPRIQTIVEELLDRVQPAGQIDLITEFAFPLPVMVISELLGIPIADQEKFKKWTKDLTAFTGAGRARPELARQAQKSVQELTGYFRDIARQRRQNPGEDLLSGLVAVVEGEDRLSEAELFGMSALLLAAGHDTTVGLIGNGLLALLRHPDQRQKLQADPSFIEMAVEELVRYDNSLQYQQRVAAEDLVLRGQNIQRGQRVMLMLGAANRDPAQFPNPNQLDICRQPNRHVAFGYGIHFCLGAPLARLEGQIAINAILRRMPNLRLAGQPIRWREELSNRNPQSLPLLF